MSTRIVQIMGTVRIADSIHSPDGTVRVFVSAKNGDPDSKDFAAKDIAKTPGQFSFNVSSGNEYRVWAEWGAAEAMPVFYLIQDDTDSPVHAREIVFE